MSIQAWLLRQAAGAHNDPALTKLQYRFTRETKSKAIVSQCDSEVDAYASPIYPGLYCPSGLDVMTVLFRIYGRPNPQINLGPIDCSVAMIVCDLALPDHPIVYASEPFLQMTGYHMGEIQGRNCRFLQAPGGDVKPRSVRKSVDKRTVRGMRDAIKTNTEHQTTITNFKKDGSAFLNILTIIPIPWDGKDYRYSVGFQCEK